MFLLVTPRGSRLWRLKYRVHGRGKLLSLGAYPDVTLKRAREKRDVARKLLADGVDPRVRRQAERAALAQSFEGVAKEWLKLQTKSPAPETISILTARLDSGLYPYIGSRPISAITAQEVLIALRRIEARGRHETAHRVRALAGLVFRYAVATGRAQHDVAADLKGALAPVKSRNFASVSDSVRVGDLMRAIHGYSGHPVTALALKLAPLENAEWRIPGERMKVELGPLGGAQLARAHEDQRDGRSPPQARGGTRSRRLSQLVPELEFLQEARAMLSYISPYRD
ncbi:MAG: integrase arm-type DNA-binding domain-containing protein [Gammaproteobacteria bacterium]|nr:integrase arm-type DNA-binding domain-containing protein [Gammaproteobacteria bacterium]